MDVPYEHTKQPTRGFFDRNLFCTDNWADNCNYVLDNFRRFSEIFLKKYLFVTVGSQKFQRICVIIVTITPENLKALC